MTFASIACCDSLFSSGTSSIMFLFDCTSRYSDERNVIKRWLYRSSSLEMPFRLVTCFFSKSSKSVCENCFYTESIFYNTVLRLVEFMNNWTKDLTFISCCSRSLKMNFCWWGSSWIIDYTESTSWAFSDPWKKKAVREKNLCHWVVCSKTYWCTWVSWYRKVGTEVNSQVCQSRWESSNIHSNVNAIHDFWQYKYNSNHGNVKLVSWSICRRNPTNIVSNQEPCTSTHADVNAHTLECYYAWDWWENFFNFSLFQNYFTMQRNEQKVEWYEYIWRVCT